MVILPREKNHMNFGFYIWLNSFTINVYHLLYFWTVIVTRNQLHNFYLIHFHNFISYFKINLLRYNLRTIKYTLFKVQFHEFWQIYSLVNYNSSQDVEHFHRMPTFLVLLCSHTPPLCPGDHYDSYHSRIEYVLFCIWLLSPNIILLRFTQASAWR